MDIQFTAHAILRVTGRYASLVNYGEVQTAVSTKAVARQLRPGNNEVVVKKLSSVFRINDPTAVNGIVKGAEIVALCTVRNGGCFIDTVVLR